MGEAPELLQRRRARESRTFCEQRLPYIDFYFIIGRRGVRVARVRAFHAERRRLPLPLRQPLLAPLFPQGVRPSVRRSTRLHHFQPSHARHSVLDLSVSFTAPPAPRQRATREAARAGRRCAAPQPRARGERQQRAYARERRRERRRADAERKCKHYRHGRGHRIRRRRGRRGCSLPRYATPCNFLSFRFVKLTRLIGSALCAAGEGSWEGWEGPRGARAGKRGRIDPRNEETEAGSIEPLIVGYNPMARRLGAAQMTRMPHILVSIDSNSENRRALCGAVSGFSYISMIHDAILPETSLHSFCPCYRYAC